MCITLDSACAFWHPLGQSSNNVIGAPLKTILAAICLSALATSAAAASKHDAFMQKWSIACANAVAQKSFAAFADFPMKKGKNAFLFKVDNTYTFPDVPFSLNVKISKKDAYSCSLEHLGGAKWGEMDTYIHNGFIQTVLKPTFKLRKIGRGCTKMRVKGRKLYLMKNFRIGKRSAAGPGKRHNATLTFTGPGGVCG